jgi:hypothetical protein
MAKYAPFAWLTNQPTEIDMSINPDSVGPGGDATPGPTSYVEPVNPLDQYRTTQAPNYGFNPYRPPIGY